MIMSVSNNVRMTTHQPFFSTNIGGVRIGGGGGYLVEFTPTTQGEDDGNPLRCPEKDEDLLLRLKQGGDLPRCQKLEKNLEGTCKGCP